MAEGNTLEDEINEEMAEIMADIDAAQEAESEDAEAKRQPSVHDDPEPGDTPPMFDL